MKILLGLAFITPIFSSAFAQSLAPEIAPLAARYDAEIKSLDSARSAAVSRIQQSYLSDLDAAEKAATAKGNVTEIAALLKVRANVSAGSAEATPAPGMSKTHEKRHADFISALAAVDREFAPRYQAKSAAYLRELAAVASRLPSNSPVRQQIDELKIKVALGAAGGGSRQLNNKTFDNTEWLWLGQADRVWKFLPNGKIVVDARSIGNFSWRILGPDSFMISVDGKDIWKFIMNFETMESNGTHISDPGDHKRLVFKGRSSK